MATGINLLPQGAAIKGNEKVLIEGVNKFVFGGFIIFIASILAIAGYFIYTSIRLRASVIGEETLKAQVASLEQTEQSLVLIKDRLSKIKTVYAKDSSNRQIGKVAGLVGSIGDNRILQIQIASKKVTLGMVFSSSQSFGTFYKNLTTSGLYKTVILKAFSFNSSAGYVATLELADE